MHTGHTSQEEADEPVLPATHQLGCSIRVHQLVWQALPVMPAGTRSPSCISLSRDNHAPQSSAAVGTARMVPTRVWTICSRGTRPVHVA